LHDLELRHARGEWRGPIAMITGRAAAFLTMPDAAMSRRDHLGYAGDPDLPMSARQARPILVKQRMACQNESPSSTAKADITSS
jgi:hypothetical protein